MRRMGIAVVSVAMLFACERTSPKESPSVEGPSIRMELGGETCTVSIPDAVLSFERMRDPSLRVEVARSAREAESPPSWPLDLIRSMAARGDRVRLLYSFVRQNLGYGARSADVAGRMAACVVAWVPEEETDCAERLAEVLKSERSYLRRNSVTLTLKQSEGGEEPPKRFSRTFEMVTKGEKWKVYEIKGVKHLDFDAVGYLDYRVATRPAVGGRLVCVFIVQRWGDYVSWNQELKTLLPRLS